MGLIANRCALCSGSDGIPLFEVDGFPLVRCPRCRLVYTKLRPAAVAALYDEAYYNGLLAKGGYANYFAGAAINRLTFARRLGSIERQLGRRGRLLDVGCALGDFLLVAFAAGWETWGVEVSAWASEFARREHGLRVHTGTLESAAFAANSFDVVTLYDVVEHAGDPLALLREVKRLLVPGGLVHIVTPNVAGKLASLLRHRWYHYKPGEHLYYFAPETMARTIEMAGLQAVSCSPIGSLMTPAYALDRLRYYTPRLAKLSCAMLRLCHLAEQPLYLRVGEMQAWGRRAEQAVISDRA